MHVEAFSGLLPHPDVLERYHQMDPTIVSELMAIAKEEAKFRREAHSRSIDLETLAVENAHRDRMAGTWCALGLGVVVIGASVWTALMGHDWVGGILGATALATVVKGFLRK